jgi:hypothetical protein
MRTIWFFKYIKQFPEYLICSDGSVYNKYGVKLTPILSRQGYERYQFYKGNTRKLFSVRGLLILHFSKKKHINPNDLIDCPF